MLAANAKCTAVVLDRTAPLWAADSLATAAGVVCGAAVTAELELFCGGGQYRDRRMEPEDAAGRGGRQVTHALLVDLAQWDMARHRTVIGRVGEAAPGPDDVPW